MTLVLAFRVKAGDGAIEGLGGTSFDFVAQANAESQMIAGAPIVLNQSGVIVSLIGAAGVDLIVAAGAQAEDERGQILANLGVGDAGGLLGPIEIEVETAAGIAEAVGAFDLLTDVATKLEGVLAEDFGGALEDLISVEWR